MTDRLNPEALRTVADVILRHCGGYVDTTPADAERAAKAVLRNLAALPAPRTVETVAELDALPVGSVVLDPFGASATKVNLGVSRPWLGESILWFRVTSALETGYQYRAPHLPARVLWVPTEGGGDAT